MHILFWYESLEGGDALENLEVDNTEMYLK
jgi:hypothetical protein